jgi:RNA polymerase sigma factor (sigma-70 family)
MQLQPIEQVVRWLRHLGPESNLGDGVLLRRFGAGDEGALAVLVERYAGLVWGVCRRGLHDRQDAEDVFQATFLTLARKAAALDGERSLANWLYTVAVRLAGKARLARSRRPGQPLQAEPAVHADPLAAMSGRELCQALDEELQRLPEKLRGPLVLCCLEGRARDEAAAALGCSLSAVKSRLERGRALLRQALARRGLDLPAALLAAGVTALPSAAVRAAALQAARGGASPGALALASAAPTLLSGKAAAGLVVASMALLAGLGALWRAASSSPAPPVQALPAARAENAQGPAPPQPAVDRFGDALPEGALARFGTVRLRQGWSVSRVLFSPDGKKLALAGNGRPVGLWDVATGKELQQFRKRNSQPSGIDFSPDGALVAEGDDEVRLWSTKTGDLVRATPKLQASQRAVVFAKGGKLLISGGHDNIVHLWNPATGESVGKLEGHTSSVLTLAVSRDGATLASAGSDKSIRLWDLAKKSLIRELKGHDGYLTTLSFSPDGRLLASAGEQEPCRVWDLATGMERFELRGQAKSLHAACFSPDGKLLATGGDDGTIVLWDAATGKKVRHMATPYRITSLDFDPDSKTLATICAWESGPRLWNVADGTELRPSEGHRGMVYQLRLPPAASKGGGGLVTIGWDHQLLSWDLESATPKVLMRLPTGPWPRNAELSPDGLVLAMASPADNTVKLVDPQTHKTMRTLSCEVSPRFMRFSPDGKTLAIGCEKGAFYLWDWRADAKPRKLAAPEKDPVQPLLFMPDGSWLATGSQSPRNLLIHVWDVRTGKLVFSLPGNHVFPTIAIAPDAKSAAVTALGDPTLRIFDVAQRKEVRTIPLERPASALAFSADGHVLAVGEDDGGGDAIHLVDFASGQRLLTFRGHHSGVMPLQFSPDGRSLFSGGGDSTILHWDATGRQGAGRQGAGRQGAGRQGKRPEPPSLLAAWDALAGDPRRAYLARWDLLDAPKEAVALLREHVAPAKAPEAAQLQKLLAALASTDFRERAQATAGIRALGQSAEAFLRKPAATANLEVQRRLQSLHGDLLKSAGWQRTRRAAAILAALPASSARPFVQELAQGDADAVLTQEAKSLLQRWDEQTR